MRGFRCIGPAHLVSPRDYHPSDLLFFSPDGSGDPMRTDAAGSPRGMRARDFDLFMCQTAIATGACPSDYIFVATAIGEEIFNASREDSSTI